MERCKSCISQILAYYAEHHNGFDSLDSRSLPTLLGAEEKPIGDNVLLFHLILMKESGLIRGDFDSISSLRFDGITWAGYDYLDQHQSKPGTVQWQLGGYG